MSTDPAFLATIPVLRSFDEAKAREFYLDFLGFSLDWEHRFAPDLPLYVQIRRGALLLHLTEHHGDACPGATVFIRMAGIEAFHAELTARQYRHARPGLETLPWGRMLTVGDPFGNSLRFCEPPAEG
ncbi:glyoxalase superfamily protein [Roseomonas sp. USHLN139]|uniref:glyoxalase superfamily protein n=1 Tax=Roseomonas sp. USHLN139 TaxID=3081298 RepID=UPI003B0204FC